MEIGRNSLQSTFFFENKPIANSNLVEDLGVFINSELNFSYHIHDFVTRAKQRSSLIFPSFMSHNATNLKRAFITYVRPLLEYTSPVWSPSHIYLINEIESVQRSFTKRLPGMRTLSYSDRLKRLELQTLEHRRWVLVTWLLGSYSRLRQRHGSQ